MNKRVPLHKMVREGFMADLMIGSTVLVQVNNSEDWQERYQKGVVRKITKSGQVDVEYGGEIHRFHQTGWELSFLNPNMTPKEHVRPRLWPMQLLDRSALQK